MHGHRVQASRTCVWFVSTISCTRPTSPVWSRTLMPREWKADCVRMSFTTPLVSLPVRLVLLLRDVHPEPWLDVFAVLPVHAFASFTFRRWRRCRLLLHSHLPGHPCRNMLRRHRDEHTRLRFPACHIAVHLVRCPIARNDAAGFVPDVLVSAGRC